MGDDLHGLEVPPEGKIREKNKHEEGKITCSKIGSVKDEENKGQFREIEEELGPGICSHSDQVNLVLSHGFHDLK